MASTGIAVKCWHEFYIDKMGTLLRYAMTGNSRKFLIHYLDMVGVTGSIPVAPTIDLNGLLPIVRICLKR